MEKQNLIEMEERLMYILDLTARINSKWEKLVLLSNNKNEEIKKCVSDLNERKQILLANISEVLLEIKKENNEIK